MQFRYRGSPGTQYTKKTPPPSVGGLSKTRRTPLELQETLTQSRKGAKKAREIGGGM